MEVQRWKRVQTSLALQILKTENENFSKEYTRGRGKP